MASIVLLTGVCCLSSSSVTLPAGGPAAGRARGRSGGRHCTAGQYGYVPLGRHLVSVCVTANCNDIHSLRVDSGNGGLASPIFTWRINHWEVSSIVTPSFSFMWSRYTRMAGLGLIMHQNSGGLAVPDHRPFGLVIGPFSSLCDSDIRMVLLLLSCWHFAHNCHSALKNKPTMAILTCTCLTSLWLSAFCTGFKFRTPRLS